MGQSLGDEIDCGNCFDHIDDLLEDLDDVPTTTSAAAFPPIWSSHSDSLLAAAGADPGFSADISLLDELSVYDNVELQWLPNLADDSLASSNQFRVSGPVSVLDSSSSSSSSESFCGERKDEPSKRAWQSSPTSSGSKVWSDSENSENGESCWPRPAKKMKNHAKLWSRLDVLNSEEARKCLHCEVRKTPQWRAGPLGPKTLCNACGVRYKSGRLYPEYRPAASPSFVPCLHSNSHKKVLEMRIKQVENGAEEEFPNRSSIIGQQQVE